MAVLLKPRPCLYHSLIEFSVLLRVKSNMKRIATASLQTRGSILTNSLWPPRSQIEKVISVFRIEMVFSMKFTPDFCQNLVKLANVEMHTQCLYVIFIPASFYILDHEASLPNLSISHHADFDDNTALCSGRF